MRADPRRRRDARGRRVFRPDPPPATVPLTAVLVTGVLLWSAALATLLVGQWHTGPRAFWPWACVTGIALGLTGILWSRSRRRA